MNPKKALPVGDDAGSPLVDGEPGTESLEGLAVEAGEAPVGSEPKQSLFVLRDARDGAGAEPVGLGEVAQDLAVEARRATL